MVHQLVREATPQEALGSANRYAALVAARNGARPELTREELAVIGL
jgi:sugar/nucleoside kinase (ribokinase family)